MKNVLLCVFLIAAALAQERQLQTVYDVIIIGAGAAGIGASMELTSRNIPHLILEANTQLGGRVSTTTFRGNKIDPGASFVHDPSPSNLIDVLVDQLGFTKIPANLNSADLLYQQGTQDDDDTLLIQAQNAFTSHVKSEISSGDKSLQACWNSFNSTYSLEVLHTLYFMVQLNALANGATMSQFSASKYHENMENKKLVNRGANDYTLSGGMQQLLEKIHQELCKGSTIEYSKFVNSIDYSGQTVTVTTSEGQTYLAKKVISTLPLGVLKAKSVTFTPALPGSHVTAIDNIGFGVLNKIFAYLNQSHWDNSYSLIKFRLDLSFYSAFKEAFVMHVATTNILMFFIPGGIDWTTLNAKNTNDIINQLNQFLNMFTDPDDYSVSSIYTTFWEREISFKGSYSFYKVGTTKADFEALTQPIDQKLYFAGEHAHPTLHGTVHAAFESGVEAAKKTSPIRAFELLRLFSWSLGLILLAMF